jgi:large subunit ribosomal protein L30
MSKKLRIKQIRSVIGATEKQRVTISGLGLGRIGREVLVSDTPSFRGAIKSVLHLVKVEVIA